MMKRLSFVVIVVLIITGGNSKCVHWQQTRNCDPHDDAISGAVRNCQDPVPSSESGFCLCTSTSDVQTRRRLSDCDHHSFTCDQVCSHQEQESQSQEYGAVSCGSSVKLVQHSNRFRLHSHAIKYGTGSQQQSVTAVKQQNDPNSYWLVKEAFSSSSSSSSSACQLGQPIRCGDTIRLEHVRTGKNLHTHAQHASPLSHHHEVSAFGVEGEGDASDNWIVHCLNKNQQEEQTCPASGCEQLWRRDTLVELESQATPGMFLHAKRSVQFDDSNCPGCPINGQLEVCTVPHKDANTQWFASEGIYIAPQTK